MATRATIPICKKVITVMRKTESVLDKKVTVRRLGSLIGGSLIVAVAAGVFWHRHAIKRLIQIRIM
jgi:hypothetical protein